MKKENRIPINIWDDFYDDGYVPEGKIQETYIYVEDDSTILEQMKYLRFLLDYINEHITYLDGVKLYMIHYDSKSREPQKDFKELLVMISGHFDRQEIRIEHMTHEQLDRLLEDLQKANLSIDGKKFDIYSES